MQPIPGFESMLIIAIGIIGALTLGGFWLVIALMESPRDDWPLTAEGCEECKLATQFYELRSVVPMAIFGAETQVDVRSEQ